MIINKSSEFREWSWFWVSALTIGFGARQNQEKDGPVTSFSLRFNSYYSSASTQLSSEQFNFENAAMTVK